MIKFYRSETYLKQIISTLVWTPVQAREEQEKPQTQKRGDKVLMTKRDMKPSLFGGIEKVPYFS